MPWATPNFQPSDEYDLVHVHHFGRAALQMATSRSRARFRLHGTQRLDRDRLRRSVLRRSAFRYVVNKADAFVALLKPRRHIFAAHGAEDKVHLIPNGIPADVFRARNDRTGEMEPILVKPVIRSFTLAS